MSRASRIAAVALVGVALAGCRGGISHKPPIHPNQDMDFQPKLRAQSESKFASWLDHRGMRTPVAGTVRRLTVGEKALLAKYPSLEKWKLGEGKFVAANPLPKTPDVLARGRERFNITCAVCHGRDGKGGMVARRWSVAVPPLTVKNDKLPKGTSDADRTRILDLPVGSVFDVITNGRGTMPSYAHQIGVYDRWAIIHYLEALQLHFNS